MKAKHAGILATILAATCCAGPLLLVAIGLGSGAVFMGRYRWFFLIGSMAVLGWAWTKYLREKAICDCAHKRRQGQRSGMFALLTATVLVLGFSGLDLNRYIFGSATAPAQLPVQPANGLNHVVIPVEGVGCVTCEIPVRLALKRVDGVKSVQINGAGKTVTVNYEPMKTDPKQLVAAINSTGFRASLPNN